MFIVVGIVASALAGAVQGCTGFGFAMIMVPLTMLFIDPVRAVPMVGLLSFSQTVFMFVRYRAHARRATVLPLLCGAGVGAPIGIYALTSMDPTFIKVGVGVLMVLIASALYFDVRRPMANTSMALPGVGFVSGLLGGSTALTGPPVILFLANQGARKDEFRASLVAYFSTLGVLTLGIFAVRGMLDRVVLTHTAMFLPLTCVATYLGARFADRVSEEHFRRIATVCAGIMGAVLVVENLRAL